ncbi:MAG: C cytochrome precursor [Verrucomicrobiales bacterium]|nr:C cytochrome precursor [Verrucomicrobiales bacterium]
MWKQINASDPLVERPVPSTQSTGPKIFKNGEHPPQMAKLRPQIEHRDGYIGSESCAECHKDNHESWFHSYHRTMTQVVTSDRVMGDFNNVEVSLGPKPERYKLTIDRGLCWIEMGQQDRLQFGQPGERQKFPIVMSTGSHHQQAYWFPLGAGRTLGLAPIVYLKEARRWIPRTSTFLGPHTDVFGVEPSRWNTTCIHCHSTHGEHGGELLEDRSFVFNSRTAEFGISCEACHGPAEQHVAVHRDGHEVDDPIVNPADLPHDLSAQTCGGCHSLNEPHKKRVMHIPGQPLAKTRKVSQRDEESAEFLRQEYLKRGEEDVEAAVEAEFNGYFWADGMVRIAGREYNGLLETACHTKGEMSCISCHKLHKSKSDPRSWKEWADDQMKHGYETNDKSCTQCHESKQFANIKHTHHAAGSSGSLCLNCHMPHSSYGLLKAIRSHTITSPNLKESVEYGRPNACNLCHLDKTLEWSGKKLAEWYGHKMLPLTEDQKKISAAASLALEGDAAQRALIAWAMGWEQAKEVSSTDWMAPYLAVMMNDSYDAVRYIAQRSMGRLGLDVSGYDFIALPKDRTNQVEQVVKQWTSARRSPNLPGTVLVDQQTGVVESEVKRLLARRNNRRIVLTE